MIGKVGEIGDFQSEITASICTVTGTICKSLSFIYDAGVCKTDKSHRDAAGCPFFS